MLDIYEWENTARHTAAGARLVPRASHSTWPLSPLADSAWRSSASAKTERQTPLSLTINIRAAVRPLPLSRASCAQGVERKAVSTKTLLTRSRESALVWRPQQPAELSTSPASINMPRAPLNRQGIGPQPGWGQESAKQDRRHLRRSAPPSQTQKHAPAPTSKSQRQIIHSYLSR